MKKPPIKLKTFAYMNLGTFLLAVGIYFFKTPNGFATGGISGLSIILNRMFGVLTEAQYMTIINVFLLILGVVILGKECGGLTIYCSLAFLIETLLLEHFIPLSGPITNQPLLELVYAVLITGVGAAILFKCNASSGGTDIIALILKKYTHMNVATALLCADFLVALSSFVDWSVHDKIVFDIQTGMFSVLGLFAKSFVVDDVIDSINMCKSFTIITTKPNEIAEFIMQDVRHGVTTYPAKGAYTGADKTVIVTVCRRPEARRIRRKVLSIDPEAFIIITKTSEIMGKGFRDTEN